MPRQIWVIISAHNNDTIYVCAAQPVQIIVCFIVLYYYYVYICWQSEIEKIACRFETSVKILHTYYWFNEWMYIKKWSLSQWTTY